MTTLRNLNRAVQSITFPGNDFAQAVREWIGAATERMEGASNAVSTHPDCNPRNHRWSWGYCLTCRAVGRPPEPANKGGKVKCPHCKQMTSESHVKGGYPLPSI